MAPTSRVLRLGWASMYTMPFDTAGVLLVNCARPRHKTGHTLGPQPFAPNTFKCRPSPMNTRPSATVGEAMWTEPGITALHSGAQVAAPHPAALNAESLPSSDAAYTMPFDTAGEL